MRKAYSSPKLVEYGDIACLTQGLAKGVKCEVGVWSVNG